MARISEMHYSNAYAKSSGVNEFLEVALSDGEDPADFTVAFYQSDGSFGAAFSLDDPRVQVTYDADSGEYVYVVSADHFPILLTDPNGGGSTNYEAFALVDDTDGEVVNFYDIGGGTQNIEADGGPADGAISENVPVPTGPNAATYSIQFNQPNPDTFVHQPVSPGDSGTLSPIDCFVTGTRIATPLGEVAVEDLVAGDLISTLDAGDQKILWVKTRSVQAVGKFAPVEFAPGTIGNRRKLLLSPQHRVLISGPLCELLFGTSQTLVPATHLVNDNTILRRPGGIVDYHHIMLENHQIICANGAWCETYFVSARTLDMMTPAAREEFETLFPELAQAPTRFGPLARPVLNAKETRALIAMQ